MIVVLIVHCLHHHEPLVAFESFLDSFGLLLELQLNRTLLLLDGVRDVVQWQGEAIYHYAHSDDCAKNADEWHLVIDEKKSPFDYRLNWADE